MTTRWRLLVVEESVNWNIRVAIRTRTYVENFVETPSHTYFGRAFYVSQGMYGT